MKSNQKTPKIIHPFLFAIFPILYLFTFNVNSLPASEIILPIVAVPSITFVIWLILGFVLKNRIKAGIIVSIGLVLFFSYGHIHNILTDLEIDLDISRHRYLLIPFFSLFIASTIFFVKTKRKLNNLTTIINVIAISLVIFSVVNITSFGYDYLFSEIDTANEESKEISTVNLSTLDNFPDIYYIILDGYAGSSILKDVYNFDNSEFISYLENKGFYVPSNSHTNYAITKLSLASALTLDYVNYLTDELGRDNKNQFPIDQLIQNNVVMKDLKSFGYDIVILASSQRYTTNLKIADTILCGGQGYYNTEFTINLVKTSILKPIYVIFFETHRDKILCAFSTLPEITNEYEQPIFVFAHIINPHPPWLFGPNCEDAEPTTIEVTDIWDDDESYINQVKCVNKKIQDFIDVATSEENPPVIILQGDHGTGTTDMTDLSTAKVNQRMTIFNAYHLPGDEEILLNDSITPVNSFRIVFNTYFNGSYNLLEDRSYYGNHEHPYDLKDVTELLTQN